MPKYKRIWDVSVVLNHLRTLHPNDALNLKQLTHKLVMLIALISAQRLQSLEMLDLKTLYMDDKEALFLLPNELKQSRPGYEPPVVKLAKYDIDGKLDVIDLLHCYIKVTAPLRGTETRLFISFAPPHKHVTCTTLARWIKQVMSDARVDISLYGAHSTRAAATSAAHARDIPIDNILQTAGWSSAATFAKYYNKPIAKGNTFAKALLEN